MNAPQQRRSPTALQLEPDALKFWETYLVLYGEDVIYEARKLARIRNDATVSQVHIRDAVRKLERKGKASWQRTAAQVFGGALSTLAITALWTELTIQGRPVAPGLALLWSALTTILVVITFWGVRD